MIREGNATIMALDDGLQYLPGTLADAITDSRLWGGLPVENPSVWIPFAVFGIHPVKELGHWCGCITFDLVMRNELSGINARLFHRKNMERERRVAMFWMEDAEAEGHVVAVEDFNVMKDFFRHYKEVWRTESARRVAN